MFNYRNQITIISDKLTSKASQGALHNKLETDAIGAHNLSAAQNGNMAVVLCVLDAMKYNK